MWSKPPQSGFNRGMRPLRVYLLALVTGVVVPALALITVQAMDSAARQQALVEAGLANTSRALATSVEHELLRSVAALEVLAASPRLAAGDMAGFYAEARAAAARLPWYTVWLADASGQEVMNLLRPLGAPLPSLGDRPYFIEALRTGKWVASGLIVGRVSRQPNVTVAVPRLRPGEPGYVIGAALRPATFNALLESVNPVLKTATASVVGRDFIVIARNRDAERWVGQLAHADYIESLANAQEGLVRTKTLEGDIAYAAYSRLPDSGWTIGMGVLASEVEEPAWRALRTSAALGLCGLLLAGAVAVLLSRRITLPIKRLAATAEGIAMGRPDPPPTGSGITEIETLAQALQYAARATRERDQLAEQARHITAELENVEIRERQQIARDLHDDLSQTLTAALIRLSALQRHADPDVARRAGELADLLGRANNSTRSLAEQLSPPVLYELGLVPALEWLAQQLEKDYGLQVQIADDGRPKPLSVEASSIVFRCVRELLINVSKHAQTQAARVELGVEDGRDLVIHVLDAGRGIDPSAAMHYGGPGRLGLRAVKERLGHLGGEFRIAALPAGGSDASLRLPLQRGDATPAGGRNPGGDDPVSAVEFSQ